VAFVRGSRTTTIATLLLAGALAGCGGGTGTGGNAAIELTKRLPTGAAAYTAVDLAAYKDAQGLPEDADPMSTAGLATVGQPPFDVFYPPVRGKTATVTANADIEEVSFHSPRLKALDAIDPGSVTAAATSQESDRNGEDSVAVFATSADTGEIGSQLGDLGYMDVRGVLEAPGRCRLASDPSGRAGRRPSGCAARPTRGR
jgi:hypothetical protein